MDGEQNMVTNSEMIQFYFVRFKIRKAADDRWNDDARLGKGASPIKIQFSGLGCASIWPLHEETHIQACEEDIYICMYIVCIVVCVCLIFVHEITAESYNNNNNNNSNQNTELRHTHKHTHAYIIYIYIHN